MCGLIFDAAALVGLVMMLNQETETPGFGKALLAALAISLLTYVGALGLGQLGLGLLALVILIPAAAAVAGGVLFILFDVPPLKAALGGVIFLVYKIVMAVVFALLMAPAAG